MVLSAHVVQVYNMKMRSGVDNMWKSIFLPLILYVFSYSTQLR